MSTPGVANPRARPRFSRVQSPQNSQLRRHLCTSQSRAHFLPRPWLSCREGSADPSSRPAPAARGQLASQPSGRWIAQTPRHQEFNPRDVTAVLSCRSKTKMSEIRHKNFAVGCRVSFHLPRSNESSGQVQRGAVAQDPRGCKPATAPHQTTGGDTAGRKPCWGVMAPAVPPLAGKAASFPRILLSRHIQALEGYSQYSANLLRGRLGTSSAVHALPPSKQSLQLHGSGLETGGSAPLPGKR